MAISCVISSPRDSLRRKTVVAFENWLCLGLIGIEIGFDWVRIGFVFPDSPLLFIFIILCGKDACAHFGLSVIGFVLHKIGPICRGFSTIVELPYRQVSNSMGKRQSPVASST